MHENADIFAHFIEGARDGDVGNDDDLEGRVLRVLLLEGVRLFLSTNRASDE